MILLQVKSHSIEFFTNFDAMPKFVIYSRLIYSEVSNAIFFEILIILIDWQYIRKGYILSLYYYAIIGDFRY